jgi:hypothetical protein
VLLLLLLRADEPMSEDEDVEMGEGGQVGMIAGLLHSTQH